MSSSRTASRFLAASMALLLAFAITACGGDKNLDRPTALAILQKHSAELLRGDEIEVTYDLDAYIPVIASGWNKKRGDLSIAFLDMLASVGILTDRTQRELSNNAGTPERNILYRYRAVPQENVRVIQGAYFQRVAITLARPAFKGIEGIRQEGSQALVQATIDAIPTALYTKTTAAAEALLAECAPFPDPKPSYCSKWPSPKKLIQTETRQITFARYDDGWRVIR